MFLLSLKQNENTSSELQISAAQSAASVDSWAFSHSSYVQQFFLKISDQLHHSFIWEMYVSKSHKKLFWAPNEARVAPTVYPLSISPRTSPQTVPPPGQFPFLGHSHWLLKQNFDNWQ